MGKSALLDDAADAARGTARVLRAEGREAEHDLPWSALGEVLGPLLDEGLDTRLDRTERVALLGALARQDLEQEVEPYAVLRGSVSLLREASGRSPVLVLVDDVQWLDPPSRLAVEHLTRAVEIAGVALVVAGRPEDTVVPAVPPTRLEALAPASARALLEDLGVDSADVRGRVVRELGGNPLLLHAAAAALGPAQRRGAVTLPAVLPVPASVGRLAEDRLAAVPPDDQPGLLALALADVLDATAAVGVMVRGGAAPDVLSRLEAAGVLAVAPEAVRFSHPTLRTATIDKAGGAARRAAHGLLAEVVTDPSSRAWHRGLSLAGPEEAVAADLEEQAVALARRGAPFGAARHLELAARLSVDDIAAARRLRRAAEAAFGAGEDDAAVALLDRADVVAGAGDDDGWRRSRVRLRLQLRAGDLDAPVAGLRRLATDVAAHDPRSAAELLLDAVPALVRTVRLPDLDAVARESRRLADQAGDARLARRAEVALGIAETAVGDASGPAHLDRYREVLQDEGLEAGPFLAEVVAPALAVLRPGPEADELFTTLDAELRAAALAPALVALLAARAIATQTRRFPEAVAYGREAVDLSVAIGLPVLGRLPAISLVLCAGLVGDRAGCAAAAELLLATDEPLLVQGALIGVGALHLGLGELEQALEVYERIGEEFGLGAGVTRWEPEWCEVLVRLGRREEAAAALERAAATETAWIAEGPFDRVRGLLAGTGEEADADFGRAVAWFQAVGNRMGEGRTELCWGERSRRDRRRAAARVHLARAAALFEELGAGLWLDRARAELEAVRAAGGRGVRGVDALTARELEVARRAAGGQTNREIAESLFVSPRTIETQLAAACRKLGVANRRELAALSVDEPALRAEA